jgi:hypothetical protein
MPESLADLILAELKRIRLRSRSGDASAKARITIVERRIRAEIDQLDRLTHPRPRLKVRAQICRDLAEICGEEGAILDYTNLAVRYERLAARIKIPLTAIK